MSSPSMISLMKAMGNGEYGCEKRGYDAEGEEHSGCHMHG
jgi:hypothetical protein